MQDLRSSMEMGCSSGGIMGNNRLFFGGGGGGIGERRLRPFQNQALKCPRCDSLNTKFCYYNNYNLSQPRHFCKSCRRYWTKGGVLRNVPVGGGIRKTKQQQQQKSSSSSSSNPKKHKSSSPSTSSPEQPEPEPDHHHRQTENQKSSNNNSNSSSDSSSLTATTTTTHEAASNSTSAAYHQQLLNFNDSAAFASQTTTSTNPNSTFEPAMIHQQLNSSLDDQGVHGDEGIFQEPSSFTSLITSNNTTGSNNHGYLGFNFSDISPFRLHHQQQQQHIDDQLEQVQKMSMVDELKMQFDQKNDQLKLQELTKNFYDQNVPVELPGLLPPNRTMISGELTALDWQSSNTGNHHHQGLFDLPSAVVDQVYWSQTSQWTEHDHPLYLP